MAEHQDVWPVSVLCAVLGVSRSGFYASLPRHAKSAIDAEQVAIVARIKAIAAQTRQMSERKCPFLYRELRGRILGSLI